MNEDYKELVEYLDKKFVNINGRFDEVDQKFVKIDKRFDEVDKKFVKIDERFDGVEESFRDLQTSVGAYATKADIFFQELVMLSHKVDRHEKWLLQIAEKLGIKLEY